MTLAELQTKRDEILKSAGLSEIHFGERGETFSQDKQAALALIDQEIAKLQSPGDRIFTIQTNRGLS